MEGEVAAALLSTHLDLRPVSFLILGHQPYKEVQGAAAHDPFWILDPFDDEVVVVDSDHHVPAVEGEEHVVLNEVLGAVVLVRPLLWWWLE